MIPILYEGSETQFNTNGIGRLSDCIKCTVKEDRNGVYECEFVYPVNGIHYDDIQEGRIIYCTHDDRNDLQPFDIYRRGVEINGMVTFYAHHISYRLTNVILRPFTATSCIEAFARLSVNSVNDNPFVFWTDKDVIAPLNVTAPVSVKAILGGMQGSILDVYGKADYEWDKWTVKLYQNRGVNNHVQLRYGKNITDILEDIDVSGTYNAVAPFWKSSDGEQTVMLPEYIITRSGLPLGEKVRPVPMDLTDLWEEAPTVDTLRTTAQSRLDVSEAWLPDLNIDIDFVALWQTPGYEQLASLQRVSLCDTVEIICPELGINSIMEKVISVTYDVLAERYTEMSLGNPRVTFEQATTAAAEDAILQQVPTNSRLREELLRVTDQITGTSGGYVVTRTDADGHPYEILIMDQPTIETAVNVLRINQAGIAFSQNGYSPEAFTTAWTIDGQFVADFIATGTLNADLIKAGVISDQTGMSYWNMDTGAVHLEITPASIGAVSQEEHADSIESLQNEFNLYFNIDDNGLRIGKRTGSGGADAPYSILINNEKMSFQQYGFEVAYVQYNILHISSIDVLDRFTLGDEDYGGFFDVITSSSGLGVKWRSV
jgi:phage minor structural protein